jgi:hypothetical protein
MLLVQLLFQSCAVINGVRENGPSARRRGILQWCLMYATPLYSGIKWITPPQREELHLPDTVNSRTIKAAVVLQYNTWERYLYD